MFVEEFQLNAMVSSDVLSVSAPNRFVCYEDACYQRPSDMMILSLHLGLIQLTWHHLDDPHDTDL